MGGKQTRNGSSEEHVCNNTKSPTLDENGGVLYHTRQSKCPTKPLPNQSTSLDINVVKEKSESTRHVQTKTVVGNEEAMVNIKSLE